MRAQRKEVSYETYERYLDDPTPEVRKELAAAATAAAAAAYASDAAAATAGKARGDTGSPKSVSPPQ